MQETRTEAENNFQNVFPKYDGGGGRSAELGHRFWGGVLTP